MLALVALAVSSDAASGGEKLPSDAAEAIVSPNQDELIATLLGKGVTLAGGCRFSGGTAMGPAIRASYACDTGDIEIELRHPDTAPSDAPRSERLALVARSGPLPDGFAAALLARMRANDGAFSWTYSSVVPAPDPLPPNLVRPLTLAAGGLLLLAFAVATWRAPASRRPGRGLAIVRATGLLLIVVAGMQALPGQDPSSADAERAAGIMWLGGFLWLVATGFFGFATAQRSDWVGLIPFAVALVVREGFTIHSIQEVEIAFLHGAYDKHSVVYPLLQRLFLPIATDQHAFTMHMNAVLGALACLAIYLCARQRLESRAGGFLCGLFLATHPLVARFAPTDGQYSFVLVCWFAGLALLSAPRLTGRGLLGGAVLLGLAATSRIEGAVFLVAALLMLDPRRLLDGMRRHPLATAAAVLIGACLVGLQMSALLGQHLSQTPSLPRAPGVLWPMLSLGNAFAALLALGALSGPILRRWMGLGTALAALIVLAPVAESNFPTALHRYVPACALLAVLAGIGAHALTAWLPAARRRLMLAILPGTALALFVLVAHRGELTHAYAFNVAYDIVHTHLAARPDCTLLVFRARDGDGDSDVHDFGQALPALRVVDCHRADCVAEASAPTCVFYMRSSVAYFPTAAHCTTDATGDVVGCLNDVVEGFERAVALEPVDVRVVDLRETFGKQLPRRAEIGLFRVAPKPS